MLRLTIINYKTIANAPTPIRISCKNIYDRFAWLDDEKKDFRVTAYFLLNQKQRERSTIDKQSDLCYRTP